MELGGCLASDTHFQILEYIVYEVFTYKFTFSSYFNNNVYQFHLIINSISNKFHFLQLYYSLDGRM